MKKTEKKEKIKKTPKQKAKIALKVLLIIIAVIAIVTVLCACVNLICTASSRNFIKTIDAVEYDEQLIPSVADNGYYTFTTDEDLKVVQLTDIHIGGGFMSVNKDSMAINAVAAMITEEKPDLVIVTGDIAYPVPFQSGTFNNKTGAVLFAELMEQLGVYWAPVFGNHDTESYSYYSREYISDLYSSDEYPHCLFQAGPDDVDGYGNYIINVEDTLGEITQSLVLLDSHSYVDGDALGILWKYDCVHENQVEWYVDAMNALAEENAGIMPKSLMFYHIAAKEYRDAWYEYTDNGNEDTENVTYYYGKAGETDLVVYCSEYNYGLFDAVKELGSTQGMFVGHDHLNNFSVDYKGIRLTYGYSIDYLAYSGIMKYGLQRGCTVIEISPDGSFDCHGENYYQDKYQSVKEKEEVTMDDYYSETDE
ncbi:MAG: metallophosphoesterase [Clostridiales bacterium]|nr:metallophosphoesterase [Clostridiales bacterium]